jgi:hypothetical protein
MIGAMIEDRVSWMLWNWSRWMYGGATRHLRHRSRASAGTGWGTDSEALVEKADLRCAEATDACVDDLPAPEHAAVYAMHLEGLWALPEPALAPYYRSAVGMVGRGLDKRGIV